MVMTYSRVDPEALVDDMHHGRRGRGTIALENCKVLYYGFIIKSDISPRIPS
jgi:hypothetical protein